MSKYEELIENRNLYDGSLVTGAIKGFPAWFNLNPRNREHFLRKALTCLLLCNSRIARDPVEKDEAGPSEKRIKLDSEPSSSGSDPNFDKYQWYSLYGWYEETRRADLEIPSEATCDIWDRVNKQGFIVSFNEVIDAQDLDEVREIPTILCDPLNATVVVHSGENPVESPPGIDLASNFLFNRKSVLLSMNVIMDSTDYEGSLLSLLCPATPLTPLIEQWIGKFWSLRNLGPPKELDDPTSMRNLLKPALLQSYVDQIEDPRLREAPEAKWTGKVLPPFMLHLQADHTEADDSTRCTNLLRRWNIKKFEGALGTVISFLLEKISSANNSQNLCPVPDCPPELLEMLGVNRKTYTRDENDPTTEQPETRRAENLKAASWFPALMKDLACRAMDSRHCVDDFNFKPPSEHPLAFISSEIVAGVIEITRSSNVGSLLALSRGFYSRIGGAYRNNHNVSMFPLSYTGADGKYSTGITIVAPPHARRPGDKIFFVTIEEILNKPRARLYARTIFKGEIAEKDDMMLVYRRNSVNKEDPSYVSFNGNCMFVVCNALGELVLQKSENDASTDAFQFAQKLLADHKFWISERICEATLMCLLGKSQEEGAFAFLRKIYLMMHAVKKGRSVLTLDVTGFCDKLNECTQTNALEMYWVSQFIDALKAMISSGHH